MEQEANYNIFRAGLHPNSTVFWHQTWIVLMRINARVEHSHFSTGHKFAWNTSPTENTDTKTTLCGSDSFFKRNYLTEGFEKTTKERERGLIHHKYHHQAWMLRMKRDTQCSFSIWATFDLKHLEGGSVPPRFWGAMTLLTADLLKLFQLWN